MGAATTQSLVVVITNSQQLPDLVAPAYLEILKALKQLLESLPEGDKRVPSEEQKKALDQSITAVEGALKKKSDTPASTDESAEKRVVPEMFRDPLLLHAIGLCDDMAKTDRLRIAVADYCDIVQASYTKVKLKLSQELQSNASELTKALDKLFDKPFSDTTSEAYVCQRLGHKLQEFPITAHVSAYFLPSLDTASETAFKRGRTEVCNGLYCKAANRQPINQAENGIEPALSNDDIRGLIKLAKYMSVEYLQALVGFCRQSENEAIKRQCQQALTARLSADLTPPKGRTDKYYSELYPCLVDYGRIVTSLDDPRQCQKHADKLLELGVALMDWHNLDQQGRHCLRAMFTYASSRTVARLYLSHPTAMFYLMCTWAKQYDHRLLPLVPIGLVLTVITSIIQRLLTALPRLVNVFFSFTCQLYNDGTISPTGTPISWADIASSVYVMGLLILAAVAVGTGYATGVALAVHLVNLLMYWHELEPSWLILSHFYGESNQAPSSEAATVARMSASHYRAEGWLPTLFTSQSPGDTDPLPTDEHSMPKPIPFFSCC